MELKADRQIVFTHESNKKKNHSNEKIKIKNKKPGADNDSESRHG